MQSASYLSLSHTDTQYIRPVLTQLISCFLYLVRDKLQLAGRHTKSTEVQLDTPELAKTMNFMTERNWETTAVPCILHSLGCDCFYQL